MTSDKEYLTLGDNLLQKDGTFTPTLLMPSRNTSNTANTHDVDFVGELLQTITNKNKLLPPHTGY